MGTSSDLHVTALDEAGFEALAGRMLGGPVDSFLATNWQRLHLHIPNAAPECVDAISIDDFLKDMEATQKAPYPSVGVREGTRYLNSHDTTDDLRRGIADGAVSTIKMSRIWHEPTAPSSWTWARVLLGAISRSVSMIYMSPHRSEDVDLFLAGPDSALGAHYDTTEVFTIQLVGERRWTIEQDKRTTELLEMARGPGWNPAHEIELRGPVQEVVLTPGDALYMPAYGVHQVTGVSWSVSLSLGLRSFTEIDVVDHILEVLRSQTAGAREPLESYPASTGEQHVQARLALLRRVRELLGEVEMAAMGATMAPFELPPTFAFGAGASPPTAHRMGFAVPDER